MLILTEILRQCQMRYAHFNYEKSPDIDRLRKSTIAFRMVVLVLIAQLCLTLHDPMDWSPPGSSIHGIFQAQVLELSAIPFSQAYINSTS